MVTICVPASTANIGPGFDSFGCALALYNEYTFEPADHLEIIGCPPEFSNEDNLVIVAFKRALEALQEPWTGLKLTVRSGIPFCRGLGSSAAVIVGGIRGANALHGNRLTTRQMLEIATELEGHPDNVAPALLGGFVISMMDGDKPLWIQRPVHPELRFIALIPDFSLSTRKARSVLPPQIPRDDAVFNVAHAGVLPYALESGDEELIRAALQDRLHEPYRRSLITDIETVEQTAREQGALSFCISGAGPTCLCLTRDPEFIHRLKANLKTPNSRWEIREIPIAPTIET